jgi:hypothetical protein
MAEPAKLIRVELDASPQLVVTTHLPDTMTLVKRPLLSGSGWCSLEPRVGIREGGQRVCSVQTGELRTSSISVRLNARTLS